jgi:adenylate cyclase
LPFFRPRPFSRARGGPLAILVVDVVSSTELFEKLGDRAARDLIAQRLDAVTRIVLEHHGRLVKSLGDGLLCTLPSPAAGLAAVTALQALGDAAPRLRTGLHAGEVLEESDDVFGDTVNTAARVAGVCNPGEVLLSSAVVDALDPAQRAGLRSVRPVTVKGKREPLTLYALPDREAGRFDQTLVPVSRGERRAPGRRLTLSFGGQEVVVDEARPTVSLGRDADCDLVLSQPLASRRHAEAALRGGRIVLIDRSANGTWIVPDGQPALGLHREEGLLTGSGCLHCGCDPATDDAQPVRYRLDR